MRRHLNILFVLSILLLPDLSKAQISGGTFITGGSFSFEYRKEIYTDTEYKIISFDIEPVFGLFLFNNFSLELDPFYGYSVFKSPFDYSGADYLKDKEHSFGFSPRLKYYFGKKQFHPFLQMGTSFCWVRGKSESYYTSVVTSNYSSNNIYIQPGAGLLYRINENIGIDLTLIYNWHNRKYKDGRFNSEGTVKYRGLKIYFGFKIFFAKK